MSQNEAHHTKKPKKRNQLPTCVNTYLHDGFVIEVYGGDSVKILSAFEVPVSLLIIADTRPCQSVRGGVHLLVETIRVMSLGAELFGS